MNQDVEHLRLLSIFHYVLAGLLALYSCIPFIHVTLGILMLLIPNSFAHGAPGAPALIGFLFIIIGGFFITVGWTLSVFIFLAGRNLQLQRNHTFCLVVAAVMCLFMPFGTILGIFTIIILSRPTVRQLFQTRENFV